jgi:hypothetical protein
MPNAWRPLPADSSTATSIRVLHSASSSVANAIIGTIEPRAAVGKSAGMSGDGK